MSQKVLIIGGGPGGYTAAQKAASAGADVTLFEKERLSGTCGIWGCIPTKTLYTTASAILSCDRLKRQGLTMEHTLDFTVLKARMNAVKDSTEKGVVYLMEQAGVKVVIGEASVDVVKKTVTCNGETFEGDSIILATGTTEGKPGVFNVPGVWTSKDLLMSDELPESMVVIGGGAVGVEFATIYNAFGVKVTLIEMIDRILPVEDAEISKNLKRAMTKQGVKIITGKGVASLIEGARGVVLNDDTIIDAERVLLAIGRKVLSDYDGLEMDGKFIKVNDKMETSVSNIFAIGDIVGGKMLAHEAHMEGVVAGINAAGGSAMRDWNVMPAATFCHPEVASVGLTEEQAKDAGTYHVGKFIYRALGKGLAEGHQQGFVKIIADEDGAIIGGHIFGHNAPELIAELVVAMENGMTVKEIANMVHTHPTLPELVQEACKDCSTKMKNN